MSSLKTYIIVFFLFFVCFSVSGQFGKKEKSLEKVLKYGDYQSIIQFSGDIDPDEISSQFKIFGQVSLEYGSYEKAAIFYEKALLLDKKNIQEKDVTDYYYSLLKCGKENEVINDSLGLSFSGSSKVVRQLIRDAKSRAFYKGLKFPDITAKEMKIKGILPRYGFTFNDYYLYFSYQKGVGTDGELIENNVFSSRVADRSYLGQARFIPTGDIGGEGPVMCKFKDKRRVVTLCKSIKQDADFYTIVPENGKPERIGIRGGDFPAFPFNSEEYACAMPFFDEKTNRLYFSSTMRGGIGGWDIYYATYNGTRWNNPVNLGSEVNSPFDELFPVVCDTLLCFSSDGWEGYGGFDNYVFNDKEDSRTNLIFSNSAGDDYCFQVIDGEKFQGIGIKDKKPTFFTYNQTFHSLLDSVNSAITGEAEKEFPGKVLPETHEMFSTSVEKQKMPSVVLGKSSLLEENQNKTVSERVRVPGEKEIMNRAVSHPIPEKSSDLLITASGQQSQQLGTVYFDINSPVINSEYYSSLDDMVDRVIKEGIKNIVVWGHADKTGTGRYNDYLSFMRALGVVEYMKSRLVSDKGHQFFTIVAGEEYAKGISESDKDDRKVVIREGLRELPYSVIYTYKALPEQSLEEVAAMFNNDVEILKQMNELTSMPENRLLLVGIQGIHLVVSGENLFRISVKYHCSEDALQRLNKKEDRSVYAGEKLFIPLPNVK